MPNDVSSATLRRLLYILPCFMTHRSMSRLPITVPQDFVATPFMVITIQSQSRDELLQLKHKLCHAEDVYCFDELLAWCR
jgi:hypothetical protein